MITSLCIILKHGLAFFFTEVPKNIYFTLTANIKADNWVHSNAQEGFMVLARDSVGINGDNTNPYYSNSYGFMVSAVDYAGDDDQAISMELGVGTRKVTGVTDASLVPESLISSVKTLETSCATREAGTYKIIGNGYTAVDIASPLTEFEVTLKRTHLGLHCVYTTAAGEAVEDIFPDWEKLFIIDKNSAYVGFAVARDMEITVTDISFSEYAPADYTAVDTAIAKIPADLTVYTDESVAALTAAKNAVVYDKNTTEQTTVDGYATAIENAIAALVIDNTSLNDTIEDAEKIFDDADIGDKPGQYPQDAADKLKDAIDKAKEVLNDPDASQADMDKAKADLLDAIEIFENSKIPLSPGPTPNTGDSFSLWLWLALATTALGAAIAMLTVKKRKKT